MNEWMNAYWMNEKMWGLFTELFVHNSLYTRANSGIKVPLTQSWTLLPQPSNRSWIKQPQLLPEKIWLLIFPYISAEPRHLESHTSYRENKKKFLYCYLFICLLIFPFMKHLLGTYYVSSTLYTTCVISFNLHQHLLSNYGPRCINGDADIQWT